MSVVKLMAHERQTQALHQVLGRLGWDQETMMPRGAVAQRGEEIAAMEGVLHARRTAPEVGEWIEAAEQEPLAPIDAANLREIKRQVERTRKVPSDLAQALARTTSRAQGIWAEARANNDVSAFLPILREVVRLKQEEGSALSSSATPYDALLQDYEPGITSTQIAAMFDTMRQPLVSLRTEILEKPMPQGLRGTFCEQSQLSLARDLATTFGYDLQRGRIDKSVHPFSSGAGTDIRITTRTDPKDPFNCIYSTIHEVGHACYEQNIDEAHLLTPLGEGASMGIHESQSRIYENQIARSEAFTGWLFSQMRDRFGEFGIEDERTFYQAVNRLRKGHIRTEADEVQYNLHIMLRFNLERGLFGGNISVNDVEAAWNDQFLADFGYPVDKPCNGLLQDVHWSAGLFGYFPTYALGNVYAGCLYTALRSAISELDAQLARGEPGSAVAWLRENLQQYGKQFSPRELIEKACGHPPTEQPLLAYLHSKFSELYGL